ncbi:MAG: hypothetical protein K6V36_00990 [Anaerolineae bacterium]|nr:hypothetical protein [Anaerolineae bacterium]
MSESTYKPRNFRVVRHVTKSRILDIQDALDIGKLRIELVEYTEGEGATQSVEHYAEPDALALVLYDILQGRPWEKYVEFKGSAQGETVISRVLVLERVEARNPVKITISRGPGKVTGQGAIQPLGKPEVSVSVLLSEFDARRIAFTVLRHMIAYEAATYHARVAAGTRRPGEAGAAAREPEAEFSPSAQTATEAPAAETQARMAASQDTPGPEQSDGASVAAPAPAGAQAGPRRRPGRSVESYWMAAERLGLERADAERILQDVHGDWAEAWKVLRSLEQASLTG